MKNEPHIPCENKHLYNPVATKTLMKISSCYRVIGSPLYAYIYNITILKSALEKLGLIGDVTDETLG